MVLHRSLVWYLRGEQIRRDMQHSEGIPARSFQRQWMAGPNATVAVHMLRGGLTNLTEDIELWLRQQIEDELKREHGVRWWSLIPGLLAPIYPLIFAPNAPAGRLLPIVRMVLSAIRCPL